MGLFFILYALNFWRTCFGSFNEITGVLYEIMFRTRHGLIWISIISINVKLDLFVVRKLYELECTKLASVVKLKGLYMDFWWRFAVLLIKWSIGDLPVVISSGKTIFFLCRTRSKYNIYQYRNILLAMNDGIFNSKLIGERLIY